MLSMLAALHHSVWLAGFEQSEAQSGSPAEPPLLVWVLDQSQGQLLDKHYRAVSRYSLGTDRHQRFHAKHASVLVLLAVTEGPAHRYLVVELYLCTGWYRFRN